MTTKVACTGTTTTARQGHAASRANDPRVGEEPARQIQEPGRQILAMCTEPPQKVIGGSAKSGGQFADIKTKYDPHHIFHRNADISPTSL